MKKKILVLMLIVVVLLSTVGCAQYKTRKENQGGFFASEGNYIVINSSGGLIQDVWKLEDKFVTSAESSDGWVFLDANGNSINLGGDVKVIRVKSDTDQIWNEYIEYHYETDGPRLYHEVKNNK